MTQQEIKALATEIVGDGKSPNKWFVTQSPWIKCHEEDNNLDQKLLPDFKETDVYTEVFDSYEEACDAYDDVELDPDLGIGSVMIEDREIGTVKERFLTEKIRVDYFEDEQDDSRLYKK
jgi:hypothetical protein